ncbi:MAG: hypothetical protein M1840_006272 [Geoglossum simile]|nr:MAG: hypothetical protein M1840_006272 [Geoglossum simile]
MAGRRLLDVASLLHASRSVARKHVALRAHQLDVYTNTSAIAKAVKSQTNRVAQTAKAAAALAQRLDGSPSASEQQGRTAGPTVPDGASRGGLRQVHFHEPLETSTVAIASPQGGLEARQEKEDRHSLPDGIIPIRTNVLVQDKDGSYHRSPTPTTLDPQSLHNALPDQTPDSNGANMDILQSPRVAKILGRKVQGKASPDTLVLEAEKGTPVEQAVVEGKNHNARSVHQGGQQIPGQMESRVSTKETDTPENTEKLTADIAGNTNNTIKNSTTHLPQNANYQMHESRVPSSQLGRLWHYGGLATGMAFGAVGESIRRATGSSGDGSLILSAGNMTRLVGKLSRMRGAALKLGQMISFQDSKLLPAPIQEVLQRVQDSADYMPASQRNQVLASNLGADWRDLFSSFDEIPIAAASIGQVHGAILKSTGQRVAVKVQYPGVADSIDSDLNNLSILLTASRLLPKGLYLEKTIANARTELAWECDYEREAKCGERFRELLKGQDVFVVPEIIVEASGKQVLTMERMEGVGVTKVTNLSQGQKDWVGTQILRLCVREITEFKFMQTDPNWTNFLYNPTTQKLELLDFGASREYPDEFITLYTRILSAAAKGDRTTCRDLSIKLGYLTGYESEAMLKAHISSILTLAEPFRDTSPETYDFRDQTITERIKSLIPVMVRERLAPPPEETYSLHRKLSGAFLLCARLGSRVRCREIFREALGNTGIE